VTSPTRSPATGAGLIIDDEALRLSSAIVNAEPSYGRSCLKGAVQVREVGHCAGEQADIIGVREEVDPWGFRELIQLCLSFGEFWWIRRDAEADLR
jgi:hypothetical protein